MPIVISQGPKVMTSNYLGKQQLVNFWHFCLKNYLNDLWLDQPQTDVPSSSRNNWAKQLNLLHFLSLLSTEPIAQNAQNMQSCSQLEKITTSRGMVLKHLRQKQKIKNKHKTSSEIPFFLLVKPHIASFLSTGKVLISCKITAKNFTIKISIYEITKLYGTGTQLYCLNSTKYKATVK